MKETEGFSIRLFAEKCKGKQGRARLAAAVGLLAMLLILLSELFPQPSAAGSTQKAKSAQSSTEYQAQLEERLERLISHMSGAGKTTVMVTLGTGEEMIYALDTQSGDMQSQQTHVLLEDGSALTETVCVPQVCGVAVLCEGGTIYESTFWKYPQSYCRYTGRSVGDRRVLKLAVCPQRCTCGAGKHCCCRGAGGGCSGAGRCHSG